MNTDEELSLYKQAVWAVSVGFLWQQGHRFLMLRSDGTVSGGGTFHVATYGPFLVPDLNDPETFRAYSEWNELSHSCSEA